MGNQEGTARRRYQIQDSQTSEFHSIQKSNLKSAVRNPQWEGVSGLTDGWGRGPTGPEDMGSPVYEPFDFGLREGVPASYFFL